VLGADAFVLKEFYEDLHPLRQQISSDSYLLSAVSLGNAAAQPNGRLIVIRAANFGWNLAVNLKIDGRTVANIVQGRRYNHFIPTGRHVLTVSAMPNTELRQPTSINVNVRSSGTNIFTALWDSDFVFLRPTTLSPAEMAKLRL
jgi:hypothetical protein